MSEPILSEPTIVESQPNELVKPADSKPVEAKINCGCGSSFLAKNKAIHEKTKKHMTFAGLCPAKPVHPEDGKELKKKMGKAVSYHPDAQIEVSNGKPARKTGKRDRSQKKEEDDEVDLMHELGIEDDDDVQEDLPEATIENVMKLLLDVCQRLDDLQEDVSVLLEEDDCSEEDD